MDRDSLGMFSVTREEWPGETFPDFCSDQVLPCQIYIWYYGSTAHMIY